MQKFKLSIVFTVWTFLLVSGVKATDVPGGNVSGVWNAAGSPYVITGNIRVPVGESLQIEPGVEVVFDGPYFLRILGDFNASGMEADSISFSWTGGASFNKGIRLDSLAAADTVRFKHCKISALQGGQIRLLDADRVVFEHSRFYGNSGHIAGVISIFRSTGVVVRNSYFHNNSTGSQTYGGALYVHDSSPLIAYNRFRANSASYSGGAVSLWRFNLPTAPVLSHNLFEFNTAPTGAALDIRSNVVAVIDHNMFENNTAGVSGGAVWQGYVQAGTILYTGNQFINNQVPQRGGAIRSIECKVSFQGDYFEGNGTANFSGGAIHFNDSNEADLSDCTFVNNTGGNGGAIAAEDVAELTVDRCTFANNSGTAGGALLLSSNITGSFSNCLFVNNSASSVGGVMRLIQFSDVAFVNCSFANNTCEGNGGVGSLYWDSDPVYTNCIFYGNTSLNGSMFIVQDYISNYCNPSFSHCLLESGQSALSLGTSSLELWENNIDADPLFVDPSAGAGSAFSGMEADWRVDAEFSPCMDAGTLSGPAVGEFDLNGDQRVQNELIDLGCYEGGYTIPEDTFPDEIDFNGDGFIDTADLVFFLSNFGCSVDCVGDLNGDGVVNSADLVFFLSLWQ